MCIDLVLIWLIKYMLNRKIYFESDKCCWTGVVSINKKFGNFITQKSKWKCHEKYWLLGKNDFSVYFCSWIVLRWFGLILKIQGGVGKGNYEEAIWGHWVPVWTKGNEEEWGVRKGKDKVTNRICYTRELETHHMSPLWEPLSQNHFHPKAQSYALEWVLRRTSTLHRSPKQSLFSDQIRHTVNLS